MIEKHILIQKTARYFVLGKPSPKISTVWFVCHGYGQLAGYFLKKFQSLENEQTLIIAPEGLNRFYLKGFDGRIAANWMTKEDRTNEIRDYVHYLDKVLDEVAGELQLKNVKINLLGFSQGAATILRWLCLGKVRPNNLVLWAGFFPKDFLEINPELDAKKLFQKINTTIVVGRQDEFLKEDQLEEFERVLKEAEISYRLIRFDGGHRLDRGVLGELFMENQSL